MGMGMWMQIKMKMGQLFDSHLFTAFGVLLQPEKQHARG